jgi:hypothetical protein
MKSAHIFACPPKFTPILTAIMVAPYFPKFTPILTVIMGAPYFPSLSSLPQVTVSSPLSRLSPPCSPHAVGPHLASDVCAPYGSIPTPLWLEGPFFAPHRGEARSKSSGCPAHGERCSGRPVQGCRCRLRAHQDGLHFFTIAVALYGRGPTDESDPLLSSSVSTRLVFLS